MKIGTLIVVCFLATFSVVANCNNAYSSASYGLAHAKKSLSSNNFDHQRYYAERALTAFEKTQALAADCGCDASREPIYKGLDNLHKAIDPKDWEMGRYYTKKALANAQDLMAALDQCTSGGDIVIEDHDSEEVTQENTELKNPEELEAQLALKRMAELTLLELEKSVKELAHILGREDQLRLPEPVQKTEEEIQMESLQQTRQFYLDQTVAIQKQALKALSDTSAEE